MLQRNGNTKPGTVAISWTYLPVASKLGTPSLRQSRHNAKFRLMKSRNRSRRFAYAVSLQRLFF